MTGPGEPQDAPIDPNPFRFEGDCRGCGARSARLNVWDTCRPCTEDAGHQVLHPDPQ